MNDEEHDKRFQQQQEGTAKRTWSNGRISEDDEGDLAFRVAADVAHGVVIVDFSKPVHWIGLDADGALALAESLIRKARKVASQYRSGT